MHAARQLTDRLRHPFRTHGSDQIRPDTKIAKKVPVRADLGCGTRRTCPPGHQGKHTLRERALSGSGGHSEQDAVLPAGRSLQEGKKRLAHVSHRRAFVTPLHVILACVKSFLPWLHQEKEQLTAWSKVGRVIELLSARFLGHSGMVIEPPTTAHPRSSSPFREKLLENLLTRS